MTRSRSPRILFLLPAAVALSAAACGDDSTEADAPVDEIPPAAGTCLEGTVDCDDTPGDIDGPGLEPGDDTSTPDEPSDLPVDDGVLGPEEALALGTTTEQISVRGSFYRDDTGAYLCGVLAESFPPQCGGGALLLEGFDPAALPVAIASSQGVDWTDAAVTLSGTVDNGVMVVVDVEG